MFGRNKEDVNKAARVEADKLEKKISLLITELTDLNKEIDETKTKSQLMKDIESLEKEKKELKQDKKLALEDIQHMLKMKEERESLDRKSWEFDIKADHSKEIASLNTKHSEEIAKGLVAQNKATEKTMQSILDRLPDVNVRLKK